MVGSMAIQNSKSINGIFIVSEDGNDIVSRNTVKNATYTNS